VMATHLFDDTIHKLKNFTERGQTKLIKALYTYAYPLGQTFEMSCHVYKNKLCDCVVWIRKGEK